MESSPTGWTSFIRKAEAAYGGAAVGGGRRSRSCSFAPRLHPAKLAGCAGQDQAQVAEHLAVMAEKPETGDQGSQTAGCIADRANHPRAAPWRFTQQPGCRRSQKKAHKKGWCHEIKNVVDERKEVHGGGLGMPQGPTIL